MVMWTFDSLFFHQSYDSWAPSCSKPWKKLRGLAEKFSSRRVMTWIGLCGKMERIFNALSITRWRKGSNCMLAVIPASAVLLFWLCFTIDCLSWALASSCCISSALLPISSTHSSCRESVSVCNLVLPPSSRYPSSVGPHTFLPQLGILARVGPVWQMATIISHNGVRAETRGELQSDGLLNAP